MRNFTFAIFSTPTINLELKVVYLGDTSSANLYVRDSGRSTLTSRTVPVPDGNTEALLVEILDLLAEYPAIERRCRYYYNNGSFWDAEGDISAVQLQEALERAKTPKAVTWR